jgi:hypothetical protein
MTTQHRDEKHAGRDKQEGQQEGQKLIAVIGKHVIHALGQPGDLHTVQVRRLWEGRYRVNVFVGADAACAKVAHSYYLLADGDGNIIESTPQIARHY